MSLEELIDWVMRIGRENGYVFVKKRTLKGKSLGDIVKVWIACDRGGFHKSKATVRRSGSKKIGCPFELIGERVSNSGEWVIDVRNGLHNHPAAQHPEGHTYARRLSPN